METLFRYIDGLVMALCILLTLAYTLNLSYRAVFSIRRLPLFFALFGTLLVVTSMGAHLFENGFRAVQRVLDGSFVYDYHFYSLMLMGVVFLLLSAYMVSQLKAYVLGESQAKRNFVKAAILVSLLSAPTFPLTPLGLLPTLACAISLSGLAFLVKYPIEEWQMQYK